MILADGNAGMVMKLQVEVASALAVACVIVIVSFVAPSAPSDPGTCILHACTRHSLNLSQVQNPFPSVLHDWHWGPPMWPSGPSDEVGGPNACVDLAIRSFLSLADD